MADSKDPWVEAMQPSCLHGSLGSASGVNQRPRQLTDRNDPMLPLRKIRQGSMSSGRVLRPFVPHSGANDRSTSISPPTQPVFRPASALRAQKKPPALG